MRTDTIAAIATAVSNGGISIIRVSGSEAFEVVGKIYRSKSGKKNLNEFKSHTIHFGYIEDQGNTVDEVLVSVFKAPNSYTMEDVVEINCHGGAFVTKKNTRVVSEKRGKISGTWRIYKKSIFKWKN